jgi:hypothetical protein
MQSRKERSQHHPQENPNFARNNQQANQQSVSAGRDQKLQRDEVNLKTQKSGQGSESRSNNPNPRNGNL